MAETDDAWLERFHQGGRAALEECYRSYFATVATAVQRIVHGADAETVIHEVFYRLISRPELRASFKGGDFGGWAHRVATNLAIDHRRKFSRESELSADLPEPAPTENAIDSLSARDVIERFRRERLPTKWEAVFEARFVRQLPQREAAALLGLSRTTLVYQEQQVRELLRKFVLREVA